MNEIIATIQRATVFLRFNADIKKADGLYEISKEYNRKADSLDAVIVQLSDMKFAEIHKALERCINRLDEMGL